MSPSTEPLKAARLVSLALCWCFAVIAASVGLNALIKSNQDKSRLKKLAAAPTVVTIDTSDIFNIGVAATTASLVIAILASKFFIASLLPATKALATRTLQIQAALLALGAAWLFATMVPYMVYFQNRHAIVKAFVGTTQLPDSVIKAVEAATGSTSIYKDIHYLKLVAILPWFSLLFTLITVGVLFKAGGLVTKEANVAAHQAPEVAPSSPATSMKEKEEISEKEKVEEV